MGRPFVQFVDEPTQCSHKYVCATCSCDVASATEKVWEGLMAADTPACRFRDTVNMTSMDEREEHLTSGVYILADVQCKGCFTLMGWRYLKADSKEYAYKEGDTVVESALIRQISCQ